MQKMIINTPITIVNISTAVQGEGFLPAILRDTAAPTNVPQIGQPWPEQGGIRAAYMPASGDIPFGYSIIVPDAAESEAENLAWGRYGVEVKGLSDWDGLANTAILAADDHPAAKYCAKLVIGNHSDFYLIAGREASLLRAVSPHLFSKGWHWTSTQYSSSFAFYQTFDGGTQHNRIKRYEGRVRAVRRVIH